MAAGQHARRPLAHPPYLRSKRPPWRMIVMVARRLFAGRWWLLCAAALAACFFSTSGAEELTNDQAEFFEKKIRPVLVEHCYQCHSQQSEKLQGKLLLDNREAARKGGETGPAVVPGDPDASLLVQALRYENLEMPPKGKLPAHVIADFETWIKRGAADPRESSGVPAAPAQPQIDFAAGRQFWSLQPLQPHAPPPVSDPLWLRQPLDSFIL